MELWLAQGGTATPDTKVLTVQADGQIILHSNPTSALGAVTKQYADALVADGAMTNAKLADMAANTIKANASGVSADPQDVAVAANRILGRNSTDSIITAKTVTDFGFSLLDDADAATARATLGAQAITIISTATDADTLTTTGRYVSASGAGGLTNGPSGNSAWVVEPDLCHT